MPGGNRYRFSKGGPAYLAFPKAAKRSALGQRFGMFFRRLPTNLQGCHVSQLATFAGSPSEDA
jgi:hypothetical protein